MKYLMIVALLCSTVFAADVTLQVGDQWIMTDLTFDVGPNIDVGATVGVDYFLDRSSVFGDLDIDVGDTYVGPLLRVHLLPDASPVDLYAAYKPVMRVDDDNINNILEAGLMVPVCERVSYGLSYQFCDNFKEDDCLMAAMQVKF